MVSLFSRIFSRRSSATKIKVAPARSEFRFRPLVEGLEQREVMSHSPMGPAPDLGPALVAQQTAGQLLTITDIQVTDIIVTGADTVTAVLDVTGEILGQEFTLNDVQVPVNVSLLPNPDDPAACPILHLELEIEDLNLLGLHVELNNCDEGPITVDVLAVPGTGLLGDLLGGLLCPPGGSPILDLTEDLLGDLTDVIDDVLNGVLGNVLTDGTPGNGGGGNGGNGNGNGNGNSNGPNHRCDLVNLELGAIDLNLLGLVVQTSDICLDVYAVRGGGLLGNLLCGVNNLLDGPGNPLNAINRFVDRILDIIGDLDL